MNIDNSKFYGSLERSYQSPRALLNSRWTPARRVIFLAGTWRSRAGAIARQNSAAAEWWWDVKWLRASLWATNFIMSSSAQFTVLEPVSSSLCSPESHRSHNLKPIFTTHAAKGQADSLSLDVESSKSVLKTSRRSFMTLRCFSCCNWTICCLSTLKMCVKSGEACICHVLNSQLEITVF